MPSPIDTELRVHASPVPTHTVLGLFGSIVIAPIDWTGCLSNTGLNVVPPSSERHTPPDAAPTNSVVCVPAFRPATAAIRPLIAAEPMLRAPRPEIAPASIAAGAVGAGGATTAGGVLSAGPAMTTCPAVLLGSLNQPSSTGTLTSARSKWMCEGRGSPGAPDSIESGRHTPATCAYSPRSASSTSSLPRTLWIVVIRISSDESG